MHCHENSERSELMLLSFSCFFLIFESAVGNRCTSATIADKQNMHSERTALMDWSIIMIGNHSLPCSWGVFSFLAFLEEPFLQGMFMVRFREIRRLGFES